MLIYLYMYHRSNIKECGMYIFIHSYPNRDEEHEEHVMNYFLHDVHVQESSQTHSQVMVWSPPHVPWHWQSAPHVHAHAFLAVLHAAHVQESSQTQAQVMVWSPQVPWHWQSAPQVHAHAF